MVLDKLQESLFGVPLAHLPPSKAHPEHRARRKKLEKESPAFSMGEFGIKAAMMGLLAVVACFPWEKELERNKEGKGQGEMERRDGERERRERREGRGGREGQRERGRRKRGRT